MRGKGVVVAVLLAVLSPGAVTAQPTAAPGVWWSEARPGDRIRVLFADPATGRLETITGHLVWESSHEMGVQAGAHGSVRTLSLASIRRLEVSKGRRSAPNPGRGATIGAMVGLAAGIPLGQWSAGMCGLGGDPCPQAVVEMAVLFAGLGAAIGALLGLTRTAERWESVGIGRANLVFLPGPRHGFGIGITVRF